MRGISRDLYVCVWVHYRWREGLSEKERITSVLGQQKHFIALLKEAVMNLPQGNTLKWFKHMHAHMHTHNLHMQYADISSHQLSRSHSVPRHTHTLVHYPSVHLLPCKALNMPEIIRDHQDIYMITLSIIPASC